MSEENLTFIARRKKTDLDWIICKGIFGSPANFEHTKLLLSRNFSPCRRNPLLSLVLKLPPTISSVPFSEPVITFPTSNISFPTYPFSHLKFPSWGGTTWNSWYFSLSFSVTSPIPPSSFQDAVEQNPTASKMRTHHWFTLAQPRALFLSLLVSETFLAFHLLFWLLLRVVLTFSWIYLL